VVQRELIKGDAINRSSFDNNLGRLFKDDSHIVFWENLCKYINKTTMQGFFKGKSQCLASKSEEMP